MVKKIVGTLMFCIKFHYVKNNNKGGITWKNVNSERKLNRIENMFF